MSNILTTTGVSKAYKEAKRALEIFGSVDFSLEAGQTVAIVGSSGAGKTTLLNILGGLDKPTDGVVAFEGQDIHKLKEGAKCKLRNKHIGFVYQFHHLLAEFSALDNVAMPMLIAGEKPSAIKKKAEALLTQVGLKERMHHKPSELSGGERQRVAIARSLINDPKMVLMDEPTGNLDEKTAVQVQELILSLCENSNTSFVIVTHDRKMAARMEKVFLLENGTLKESA